MFLSISSPDFILLFTAGIHIHATTVSVVVSVLSDVVASIVVNESTESVRHTVFEHSFVDPVVILSPSTEATFQSVFIELSLILVRESMVPHVLCDSRIFIE